MSFKIVIDSCGELTEEMKASGYYETASLSMQVDDDTIIDDETFDQAAFLKKIADSPNCPKSSCPSPEAYRKAFDCEADHVYGVTLSSNLSGSYNSALLGMNLLKEKKPEAKIYIFNSCSASVGETLIGLKIQECEEKGMDFDQVVNVVETYIASQTTWFVLENLETLRKNGRLSKTKAFVASALKIKPVMTSTPQGEIVQLTQARGMNKALVKMVDNIIECVDKPEEKTLGIAHCNCPERAELVRDEILKRASFRKVIIVDTAGISTMYANDGGIIIVA